MFFPSEQLKETFERAVAYGQSIADEPTWSNHIASGVLKLTMPAEWGGQGAGLSAAVSTFEGLTYGGASPGLLFGAAAQLLAVQYPLVVFGTQEQKNKLLRELIAGRSIGAHAVVERESGSDIVNMSTTAVARYDGYVLNGHKSFVTNGPLADALLVLARTDPKNGPWALTAFLVGSDCNGVERSPPISLAGLNGMSFGEVTFRDCFVSQSQLLGKEGGGMAVFNCGMNHERALILAPILGVMRRQLDSAVTEAKSRNRNGNRLGSHQSVSHRIADMMARLEMARFAIYSVAETKQTASSLRINSAIVKLFLSESFLASSIDAARMTGAVGYMAEHRSSYDVVDAIASLTYSGTSDILRNLIASAAGL